MNKPEHDRIGLAARDRRQSRRMAACVVALLCLAVGVGVRMSPGAEADGSVPAGADFASDAAASDTADAKHVAKIDQLVAAGLAAHEVSANPQASDSVFLRRAYLDVIGRIPTVAEAQAFLDNPQPHKRAQLLDQLFEAPGYTSHQFNYWADLLRVKTRPTNRVSGEPYIDWLKKSIAGNTPYDALVREMLTATGAAHLRGNGATGYLLRDRGMPLDNMANSLRIFLGTRLECAQCHNHPSERWTQRQFFEMAAYAGGVRYVNDYFTTPQGRELARAGRAMRSERDRRVYRYYRRQVLGTVQAGIGGTGTGFELLPIDYQYDDGAPNQPIVAKPIYGSAPHLEVKKPRFTPAKQSKQLRRRLMNRQREVGSRDAFATWLTSAKNEAFARVIANRMWKKLLGRGLIEPVDDLRDNTVASHPELMAYLEQLMRDVGYDLKRFQKIICSTETYQRESSYAARDVAYHFPGPMFRRMTPEQVWDSLVTLIVPDLDDGLLKTSTRATAIYDRYDDVVGSTTEELLAEVDSYFAPGADMESADDINRKRVRQRRSRVQPVVRRLMRAIRRRDSDAEKVARAELQELGVSPERVLKERQYGRGNVRASELSAPAPAGHLVRDFGQSDRGEIQGAHQDPAVPQALALINGFVEKEILKRRRGVLMKALHGTRGANARVSLAFQAILSRQPTPAEKKQWQEAVAEQRKAAYDDLVWVLINSNEFRFLK